MKDLLGYNCFLSNVEYICIYKKNIFFFVDLNLCYKIDDMNFPPLYIQYRYEEGNNCGKIRMYCVVTAFADMQM